VENTRCRKKVLLRSRTASHGNRRYLSIYHTVYTRADESPGEAGGIDLIVNDSFLAINVTQLCCRARERVPRIQYSQFYDAHAFVSFYARGEVNILYDLFLFCRRNFK